MLLAIAVLLSPAAGAQYDDQRWTGVDRVVVFGDVHGAYDSLVGLLQTAGVLGPDLTWTGGATHLVSLGDLVDRGPDSRRVLDLVMRLEQEAAAAGGRVHVVLGNHELMNLIGDWRYVTAEDYAAFAAEESAAARSAAFAQFVAAGPPGEPGAADKLFDETYPPGFFARRAAFARTGRYGGWLASLPVIVVVDDVAYLHGGLSPLVAADGLGLNTKVRASLLRYLELREQLAAAGALPAADSRPDVDIARAALATAPAELAAQLNELIALDAAPELGLEGPLWSRRSVYCKPLLERPVVDAALARLDAESAVVGHTPTDDRRARALYDGKLVMLDTGMLASYYGGRPAALVIAGQERYVQYEMPAQRDSIATSERMLTLGRTAAELRTALAVATVTAVTRDADGGPARVALRYEDIALDALFYATGAGGGELELASAALDALLGTTLVPPTVERSIEGTRGALQLRFPDAITEADRVARGVGFPGWCPIEPQLALMYAFDALTLDRGRSPDNVAYHNELSDLIVTDHRLAFGTERTLPSFDPSRLVVPPPLAERLRALDGTQLEAALGKWIDSRRIRALLARRDRLLGE